MSRTAWMGILIACPCIIPQCMPGQAPKPWNPPHYPTRTEQLPATLPHTGNNPKALTGTRLVEAAAFGRPTKLMVQGDYLLLNDQLGDPYLHLIDLRTGRLLRSFGRDGEGPGDFSGIVQFSTRAGDPNAIWAFDLRLRRVTRVPLQLTVRGLQRTVTGQTPKPGLRMLWLTANRLLIVGPTDSNRIILADSLGRVTRVLPGPLLGRAEVNREVREAASTGILVCAQPGVGSFAIAYTQAARVDLFNVDGRRLGGAQTPIPNVDEGDFYQSPDGLWHKPAPRQYYRACAATPDRLYMLFSGRLDSAGPDGTRKWDARFIHVFDWAGKLTNVLHLDQWAEGIAVQGDSLLFAAGGAMEGVYRYRLPTQ